MAAAGAGRRDGDGLVAGDGTAMRWKRRGDTSNAPRRRRASDDGRRAYGGDRGSVRIEAAARMP